MIRISSALNGLSALVSVSALAAPKLGDQAIYDATITLNGQTTAATAVLELVQQDGAKFLQRTTVTHAGREPKVTDEWKEGEALLSDAKIDEILAKCAAEGGKPASVTVPAGTFAACEIAFEGAEAKGS